MKVENNESFQQAWAFERGLSLDLLSTLDKNDLIFTPHREMGAYWKQFRHLGRIQECYLEGLRRGEMNFDYQNKGYIQGAQKEELGAYLQTLDLHLRQFLTEIDWATPVKWWGEPVEVGDHLARLISHETLHHGQFIVYMTMLGKKFPGSWSAWGF